MEKFFQLKKYYIKIIFSFTILLLAATVIISVIFAGVFVKDISSRLAEDYTNNISSVCREFDNTFLQIRQLNIFLRNSPDVVDYLTKKEGIDMYTINRADIFTGKVKGICPYVYSILLYNRYAELVITSGLAGIQADQFMTTKNRLTISGNIDLYSCTAIPDNADESRRFETFSAVFPDNSSSGILLNAIIVNIDRREMEKKLFGRLEGTLLVCDNKGRVIISVNHPEKLVSVESKEYFRTIASSSRSRDTFILKDGQASNIVTYTKSDQTDFYIINIRSIDGYTEAIRKREFTIIAISLSVLLVLLAISLVFSKSIYAPVRIMTEKFAGTGNTSKHAEFKGEFALIAHAFEDTVKQLTELEYKNAETNRKLKEEFLRCLLTNKVQADLQNRNQQEFSFNVDFSGVILVCVRIDNYHHLNNREKFSIETGLCRLLPDLLKSDFRCEAVNMLDGEIALLLNYVNASQNKFDELLSAMDRLRAAVQESLKTSLTIGIGGAAESIQGCSQAYQKALEMAKHRFILGFNKTIYPRLLEEILTSNVSFPEEFEAKLIKAIRLNDQDMFEESLRNTMVLLGIYPYSEAVSILFQIITGCVKAINQTTHQDHSKSYLHFDEFNSMFARLETLDQAYGWLMGLFSEYRKILEEINLIKSNKHYKMIEEIQAYIKNHYEDLNLCVESVAEAAGYTPYYFSKIFKDIAGMNVMDYIKKVRIDKAKELLEHSELKINDVAEAVGIPNTSHFYTIFKKDVGLTPSAYREYMTRN